MYIVNKKKQVVALPFMPVTHQSRRIHSRPGAYQPVENQAEKNRLTG